MKYTNNGHITEDTLKGFNDWLRDIYSIKVSNIHIDGIKAQYLKEALTGWRQTTASVDSCVNTIPIWLYRLFIEYMKNRHERSLQNGSEYLDDRQINRSYIVNLLDRKPIANKDYGTTFYNPVYMARIERRFTVPEGYDGNAASVQLLVPPEVMTWLHRRPYNVDPAAGNIAREDLSVAPTYQCCHPLLRANETYVDGLSTAGIVNDGGYGSSQGNLNTANYYGVPATDDLNHLTSQLYGNHRTNAFFFYQQYVVNGNIMMDVIKNKNYIDFVCEADQFKTPFMDYSPQSNYDANDMLCAPKVLVQITFYKKGIY